MAKSYSTFSDMAASNFASISGPTKSTKTSGPDDGLRGGSSTPSKSRASKGNGIMSYSGGGGGDDSTPTKQRVAQQQGPAVGLGVYIAEQGSTKSSGDEKGVLQSWYDWAFGADEEDSPIITPEAEPEEVVNEVLNEKDFPLDPRTNLPVGALPRQRYTMSTDPLDLASLEGSTQGFNPPAVATGLEVVQSLQEPPADRMTGEQREALSNMPDVLGALGQSIFTDEGVFSRPLLNTAVENSIGDPLKRGVFLGTMQKEVQDSGPINEIHYNNPYQITSPGFHSPNWIPRLQRDGLLDSQNNPTPLYSGENVFNSVYANRGGNGDFASGDGDRYRGRGLIQLTFKDNYKAVNEILNNNGINVDIVSNPDLVNDPRYALPVAMAYLQHAGLEDETLTELGPEKLNNIVNSGAPTSIARERWGYIVDNLREAGQDDLAESMSYRDEFKAQETVGTVADGVIGPNSVRAMREWLNENNIEIPEGSTAYDLVELVNRNS